MIDVADKQNTARAAAYIAEKLGLSADAVNVGIGTPELRYNSSSTTDDLGRHVLAITITHPKVAENFAEMEKSTLLALSPLEPFKGVVQFESDAANVVHRRDQLEKFRLAGAAIPNNFKDWIGFNPDLVESWGAIPKHALSGINRDEKGIGFSISIPEGENSGKIGGAVKASLESRKADIMALLEKRAVKYLTRGMDEAQKKVKEAEIATQFKNVTFEIQYNEPSLGENYSSSGSIYVTIASKEQKESPITFKDKVMTPEDKETLRNTNPLTAANPEKGVGKEEYAVAGADLAKALGRSVLFEGEKGRTPTEIFPLIAGKEDMKTAISKELVRFKEANAGMAKEVDEFLNDEAFKGSDWNKPKRLQQEHKTAPDVVKNPSDPTKSNVMSIQFNLKAEKAQELLEKLADATPVAAVQAAPMQEAPLAGALTAAAKAITEAAQRLSSWTDRMGNQRMQAPAPEEVAPPPADVALANAVLAASGSMATPNAAASMAAAGTWADRTVKATGESQAIVKI